MRRASQGRLIILEGPDGVGKTTLTAHVAELLRQSDRTVVTMSFPGREPGTLGHLIYRLHHDSARLDVEKVSESALQAMHVAAHLDVIQARILPALDAGTDVVLDRFWWSTLVYGKVNGLDDAFLKRLIAVEKVAWGRVKPAIAALIYRPIPIDRSVDAVHWAALMLSYEQLAADEGGKRVPNLGDPAAAAAAIVDALRPPVGQRVPSQGFLEGTVSNGSGTAPEVFSRLAPAKSTEVYDTYWRFAAERQEIFFRRLRNDPEPWTADAILGRHKFTNAYRASDRTSQFLIREVIYNAELPKQIDEVLFRILLFKLFNRIDTWRLLTEAVGPLTWQNFDADKYDRVLTAEMSQDRRIYSAAYIMPPGGSAFGHVRKHRNHLALVERMMSDELASKLADCRRMQDAFELLRNYPTIGDFLAYQLATDINYSEITDFSEMSFVVPGPGAKDGIRKCFTDMGGLTEAELIRFVSDNQAAEFRRLGVEFSDLWGRSLQLIDCQNLFCEVDKYARVAHPEVRGISGRTRIKQVFVPQFEPFKPWYPPKWGLNERVHKIEEEKITDGFQ